LPHQRHGDQTAIKRENVETTEQAPELRDKRTILVVDDDASILETVSDVLGHDYNVLRADSGEVGLQLSIEFKSEICLLLSDFQMPGMSGIELATQVTARRPKIKVLLMSGYPAGMLILNEGWHFLAKPFIPSQLLALIVGLVSPDKASKFSA
jgi:DNA-binding NtrC family response regulator